MAEFNVTHTTSTLQQLTTSAKTQLALLAQSATLRRGRVKEMTFGPFDNPIATDCNIIYAVFKQDLNDGTAGAPDPTPSYTPAIEGGTPPVSGALARGNYTAEPTMLATDVIGIFSIAMNQHSSFQWYAPEENSMEWAAVANKGFAFRARGASATINASGAVATVLWRVKYAE
jgi:hypothetical protein